MKYQTTRYADIRCLEQMLDFYEGLVIFKKHNSKIDIYMQSDYVICADIYESEKHVEIN